MNVAFSLDGLTLTQISAEYDFLTVSHQANRNLNSFRTTCKTNTSTSKLNENVWGKWESNQHAPVNSIHAKIIETNKSKRSDNSIQTRELAKTRRKVTSSAA